MAAVEKSIPSFLAACEACSAGLIIEVNNALIPVAASAVLTPDLVKNARVPPSSENYTPAAAAKGATVPILLDNSPKVVIPSLTVVNNISLASLAVSPDWA